MTQELGMLLDIPNEKYHSGSGISRSDLLSILRSPAHYKFPPEEEKDTPALLFGEAFHLAILQHDLFEETYVTLPQHFDGRRAKDKAFKAEIESNGMKILKYDDGEAIKGMAESIRANQKISRILKTGLAEISCFWHDPLYPDILLKCRLDWLNMKEGIILDLKSTIDARPEYFKSAAYKMGYHVQASFYLSGVSIITKSEHRDFRFVAVEKTSPYGLMWYQADEEMLQLGAIQAQRALKIYQECKQTDYWPCYAGGLQSLGVPPWAKKQQEMTAIYE